MKMKRYFTMILLIFVLLSRVVYADKGDLRYEITGLKVNDTKITFEGFAFIHRTHNYVTVYKYDDVNGTVVTSNGGQKIKIVPYLVDSNGRIVNVKDTSGNTISKTVDGSRKVNYNFFGIMADQPYETKRTASTYNDFNKMKNLGQYYYQDMYFKIDFDVSNWNVPDSSNFIFKISAVNNDYGKWTNEEDIFVNKQIANVSMKKSANLEIISDSVSSLVVPISNAAILQNKDEDRYYYIDGKTNLILCYGNNQEYKYDIIGYTSFVLGSNSFFNKEKGSGSNIFHSDVYSPAKYITKVKKSSSGNCYEPCTTGQCHTVGLYASWVKPTGSMSFRINVKRDKVCPVTGLKTGTNELSCNNSQSMISECEELTVRDKKGNNAVISIRQSGSFASILSPTEKYNGGGIKFGLLYYNKIEFNYIRGDAGIDINAIMRERINNGENINLSNVKIGNINVDSNIYKKCNQNISNNYLETVCIFHFTPQVVNSDGSISDVNNASYNVGFNNKYYLPLEYNSVYRLSGSLINASVLDKTKAMKDTSGTGKVWFGNKWDKIDLSDNSSCDVNIYKLGPGALIDNDYNSNATGGTDESSHSRIIYNYIYRPIDLDNPFPGRNRFIGLNWYNYDLDRLKNSYSNLQYSIGLNNSSISKIRNYNKKNNYFNFDFEKFIVETGIKVGGN